MTTVQPRIAHIACPHNCPDACLMDVVVQDGRAINVSGNKEHPYTRGALCAKVNRFLDRIYAPERLLYPVKRVGPKGSGAAFERISWDEAIDTIAQKMRAAIAEHGPQSILPYSYSGVLGIYQGWGFDRRFAHALGASRLDRTICDGAYNAAAHYLPDVFQGFPPEGLVESRLIIFWGNNPLNTGMHIWRWALEARRRGAKIISIDPYRSRTARVCDEHLFIRPATDAALALALMKVIVDEELVDHDYVDRYTVGFDHLADRLRSHSLDDLAGACDVPVAKIRDLARAFAQTRPAALRIGFGIQRCRGGAAAVRAVACLPALTGAWRDAGGGICSPGRAMGNAHNPAKAARPDLAPPGTRLINMMRLAEHLLDPSFTPPLKVLYFYNTNIANLPDQNTVRRALRRPDLFVALHDLFLTDTADYSDIVLPATTPLEQEDLVLSFGADHGTFNRPAIAPLGEAKPSAEVFQLLGRAVGITEPALYVSAQEFTKEVLAKGQSAEAFFSQPFVRTVTEPDLRPRAHGVFSSPSGRFEFYSERMARDGLDPLPAFVPPYETLGNGPYPLNFLSRKHKDTLNTSYGHLPVMRDQEDAIRVLEMHPRDADARGLHDRDELRVFNARGEFRIRLKISTNVPPGTVATFWGWWDKLSGGRGVVNNVTSPAISLLGGGGTFYDCRVEVERWRDPAP